MQVEWNMCFDSLLIVCLKSFFLSKGLYKYYEISFAWFFSQRTHTKKFKRKLKHEHIFQVEINEMQTKDYSNNKNHINFQIER